MNTFRNVIHIITSHEYFEFTCVSVLFWLTGFPLLIYVCSPLYKFFDVKPSSSNEKKEAENYVQPVVVTTEESSLLDLVEEFIEPESLTSQDVIDDAVSALRNIGFTKKAAVVAVNNACINEKFDDPVVLVKATLSRSNV
jgi:hypothetical protein